MNARVMLFCRAPDDRPDAVERGYHEASAALAGTPGLLRNELLRDLMDPARFVVLSEWDGLSSFTAWESGPDHRASTAPLRDLQDHSRGLPYALFEVAAAY